MDFSLLPKPGVLTTQISPILPEIEVNQVKRMEGKVYWVGGTACAKHRGGRELEVFKEVKGGQGGWSCRWTGSIREAGRAQGQATQGLDSHVRLWSCPIRSH